MNELERRVAARGEVLADGSPIQFIDKRHPNSGEPLRAVYDLHTLRVSLITALATEVACRSRSSSSGFAATPRS